MTVGDKGFMSSVPGGCYEQQHVTGAGDVLW